MIYLKIIINYLKIIVQGIIAFFTVLYFNGTIQIYIYNNSMGNNHFVFNLSYRYLDIYLLISYLIFFPYLLFLYPKVFKKYVKNIGTYKDKAMYMHHQDIISNHKKYKWSPNGVSSNPYEYIFSQTASYDDISTDLLYFLQKYFISIIYILFSPFICIIYLIIKFIKNYSKN